MMTMNNCKLCECRTGVSYTFLSEPLPCKDCGYLNEINLETSVYMGLDDEGNHWFRLQKSRKCPGCRRRLFNLRYVCENPVNVTAEFDELLATIEQ
jgi:hypothetical protein